MGFVSGATNLISSYPFSDPQLPFAPVRRAGKESQRVASVFGRGASPRRFRTLLRPHCLAFLAALRLLLGPAPALAQDEILINDDRLPRSQFAPRPALGSTGSLVVAWTDGRNGPDNAIDYDIYALTIRDPLALGSTVNRRINDDTGGAIQGLPDIASSPSGTIFLVWEDSRGGNPDIYGAALDSLGFRITPNLRMNDDVGNGEQRTPRIAAVGPDRYLVVWGDQRSGQSDIYGSYINVSGAPLTSNFVISPDPVPGGSFQGDPAVASNASGLTLVVWVDGREGGTVFGASNDIYGQWLDASGAPLGSNFKVNSTTTAQQDASPAVVADPTQGFVVAWIDRRLGTSTDPGDVYAQRYGPDRSLVGVNVRVNDDPLGRNQKSVRGAPGPGAAWLFWEDQRDAFGVDPNVQSSRVPYDSSPPGANIRVNAATPGRQGAPSAVWDGRDAFLTAWEDTRNGAPDIFAISFLPTGARRGFDTQLNDDAARNDQWNPKLGRGPGEFLLTWIDKRNGGDDLFGQWVGASGGRDGTNALLYHDNGVTRPVTGSGAVSPGGRALVAAQVTRDSDAGEIRGFLFTTLGSAPAFSFWVSDSLQSAQASPAVASRTGEFAVAWIDSRDGTPRLYGQRVSEAGARLGANHPLLSIDPADPPFALDLASDEFAGGYWILYAEGMTADQRLWIQHLDPALAPDGAPVEVAPGFGGPKQDPRLSASADEGRVEIVWEGLMPSGLGAVYQVALGASLQPLGPVLAVGDPAYPVARSSPSIAVLDSRSVVTWQEKRDGNWSIFMRVIQDGVSPVTGSVRVDQDPGQSDQIDPGVGIDAAGHAIFAWTDMRSLSSGSDILARVIGLSPTAVDDAPDPPPQDPPPAPPRWMRVGPASPNPFSGLLRVPVEVPVDAETRVRAYVLDARGRLVTRVYDGVVPGGRLTVSWNGSDSRGRGVASGVYWFVAESRGERHAVRLVRIR